MEKLSLPTPPYEPPVSRLTVRPSSRVLLVSCYASAVTALLAATLVYGAVWVYPASRTTCSPEDHSTPPGPVSAAPHFERYVENFTREGVHVMEVIDRDVMREVEVAYYVSDDRANGTVIVVDHQKSLTSIFVPVVRMCFLIAGTNPDFVSRDPKTQGAVGEVKTLTYRRVGEFPLRDTSLLPPEIKPFCTKTPLYWLEKNQLDEDAHAMLRRRKRDVRIKILWGLINVEIGGKLEDRKQKAERVVEEEVMPHRMKILS